MDKLAITDEGREQALLGAFLQQEHAPLPDLRLEAVDFAFSAHRLLFQAIVEAWEQQQPASPHLIKATLRRQERFEEAGGST